MFTPKISQAMIRAAFLHRNQKRINIGKESEIQFITHPFSVALILLEYGVRDEDIIVSSLLHDAAEDVEYTGYSLEEMGQEFGLSVKNIVSGLTETKFNDKGEKILSIERRKQYLSLLSQASESTLIVSMADKIHNMWSTQKDLTSGSSRWRELEDKYGPNRDDFWKPKIWFYEEALKIFEGRNLKNDALLERYKKELNSFKETVLAKK